MTLSEWLRGHDSHRLFQGETCKLVLIRSQYFSLFNYLLSRSQLKSYKNSGWQVDHCSFQLHRETAGTSARLPPTRLNKAGDDENTHKNNYTKHNFRNTTGEISEGLIYLKCDIPLFIRKSAEFLFILWSYMSVFPVSQGRIWPKIFPVKGVGDEGGVYQEFQNKKLQACAL